MEWHIVAQRGRRQFVKGGGERRPSSGRRSAGRSEEENNSHALPGMAQQSKENDLEIGFRKNKMVQSG
jgi:hypothetical protein